MDNLCQYSLVLYLLCQGFDMVLSLFRRWQHKERAIIPTTDTEISRDVMEGGAAAATDINMALVSETEEEVTEDAIPPMTAFDIVVVGAGGGPDESNLSAYLFKSHSKRWEDGVFALEAGSGQGTLRQLLRKNPDLFKEEEEDEDEDRKPLTATQIYNSISCFLITHAHMDHIMSLVVSAGSLGGARKRICAVQQTLDNIESSVFNDRTWPNLASYKEDDISAKFLYSPLAGSGSFETVTPDLSVRTFPLNHGHNESGDYESVAFFIRDNPTSKQFLFFGDVEPDSISLHPKTIDVWREAAPLIPHTLSTIFIECSYPSGRPVDQLYGHLTPEHLVQELVVLAKEVRKARPAGHAAEHHMKHTRKRQKRQNDHEATTKALSGLTVYVMHCKDAGESDRPISEVIIEQVQALAEKEGLGVIIRAAEQGMRIRV